MSTARLNRSIMVVGLLVWTMVAGLRTPPVFGQLDDKETTAGAEGVGAEPVSSRVPLAAAQIEAEIYNEL